MSEEDMSDEYIEVSAKTIEDAITQACQRLSVPSDILDVEVIDQGSSGFLGFNARPAVIHAKVKDKAARADHVQGDVLSEVHQSEVSRKSKKTDNKTDNDSEIVKSGADKAGRSAAGKDSVSTAGAFVSATAADAGANGAGNASGFGNIPAVAADSETSQDETADDYDASDDSGTAKGYDHSYGEDHDVDSYGNGRRSGRKNNRRSYGSSYREYGQDKSGEKNYVAHSRSTDDFLMTTSTSSRSASRRNRRSRQDRYDSTRGRDGSRDRSYGKEYGRGYRKSYEDEYDAGNRDALNADAVPGAAGEDRYDEHRGDRRSERSESRHENRYENEPKVTYTDEQIAMFEDRAKTFLTNMFRAMDMEVTITCDFDRTENILTVDFEGDDMGVLIGKRGQTLDSIQYLVSMIVNKGVPGYVHVKADTEDYRERRRKTLENLAKNMAAKVKRTRRSQALEPMNPYERRIIHSALQGDKYVTTYSEGEDPYRRVVITLKK